MRLTDALRIEPGMVVAFIGAGGKSSAMAKLREELEGRTPVVLTTTTRLGKEQVNLASQHLLIKDDLRDEDLEKVIGGPSSALLTGSLTEDGEKWTGIHLDTLHQLIPRFRELGIVLLIEADGARRRSLKVPAGHEPVLPQDVDLVVPLVGLDVLGTSLKEGLVHRPEGVATWLGIDQDANILTEHIHRLFSDYSGALMSVPDDSTIRLILNKADSETVLEQGREIARSLIREGPIRSVNLALLQASDPVIESYPKVAAVVLAAGGSTRMGGVKVTMAWKGQTLIERAVGAAESAGLRMIYVVIGDYRVRIQEALKDKDVTYIENPSWEMGQSSSVKAGLAAVHEHVDASIFLLADMPLVDGVLVEAILAEYSRTLAPIVAPWVEDRRGNPVLFDRVTYQQLMNLSGDQGARTLIGEFPLRTIPWDESALIDVDTPSDLTQLP